MPKEIVKEAATVEQAKIEAAAALGVDESTLKFEVLAEPQKKTLGIFGGSPAKVRAILMDSPADSAVEYLTDILRGLGISAPVVKIKEQNEKGCVLMLEGDGLGVVIGRRGETLDALQYLTGLVANRVQSAYYRVTLDTGNFREKREQSLTGLAKKMALQSVRTGRRVSLEPMNPYERRVIHTAVQDIKGAVSWSKGLEGRRYVIIGPADAQGNPVEDGNAAAKPRDNRRSNDRGRNPSRTRDNTSRDSSNAAERASGERLASSDRPSRPERTSDRPRRSSHDSVEAPAREVRQFVPRSNPMATADGATPPSKTQSDVENTSSLYGRIDL